MWMHVCAICMDMYVYVHVEARGQRQFSSYWILILIFETGSLAEPAPMIQLGWQASKAKDSPVSTFAELWL